MATVAQPRPIITEYRDASGGLNVRDAASTLALNESPDCMNVTLDERGDVAKRLGFEKFNTTAFGTTGDKVRQLYYWAAQQLRITQAGASLYKDTTATPFKTFTTSAPVGLADFQGRLYMIHPVDGLFYYDGSTVTAVSDPDAPKGDTLSSWQNKLWAAGNPTNAPRVSWSDAGDGAAWTAASWVDLREKDGEKVVCLTGSAGVDIAGRQGLLALKRESSYRIFDSATGEYVTLDATIGAASNRAAVTILGRTVVVSQHGIHWTDGLSTMREASALIRPLFHPARLNYAQLDLFCAGVIGDRIYVSVPEAGSAVNTLAFEYHPFQGWLVPRTDAMSCYATDLKNDEQLLGGSPTVDGRVYRLNRGGSDDGAAIASRWQCRWLEPGRGRTASILSLRLIGRGDFDLFIRKDYATAGGDLRAVSIGEILSRYDNGVLYDDGVPYGTIRLQNYTDLFSLGTCKAFSIVIEETSTIVADGPQYLRQGASLQVGAWSLAGFDILHVPLGLA